MLNVTIVLLICHFLFQELGKSREMRAVVGHNGRKAGLPNLRI